MSGALRIFVGKVPEHPERSEQIAQDDARADAALKSV